MSSGSPTAVRLETISVTSGSPPAFGDLPGDGSFGDPITGFRQINQQFADSQRAFSEATANRSNEINAQFQAQNEARNAQFQAQSDANFASMNAQREAMSAQPPITGPLLPPSFADAAGAARVRSGWRRSAVTGIDTTCRDNTRAIKSAQ